MTLPAGLPPLGPSPRAGLPEVASDVLPNGLTVWCVRRKGLPLLTLRLVVRGGRSDDPPADPDLASLLASGLGEGTRGRSARELNELCQGAGADLVAAAGDDALVVGASGLAVRLPVLLDVIADLVRRPLFPPAGLERVRAVAREELATNESEPFFLAARAFRRLLFDGHPYAVIAPTVASIEGATPERLGGEASRRLDPGRALLLAVGDADPSRLLDLSRQLLGDWTGEGTAGPPPRSAPASPGGNIHVLHRPGSVQAVLMVGRSGPSRRDADFLSLRLAVAIYGGAFASRLVTNLREEKGYSYSPYAENAGLLAGGFVRTTAATRTEVAGPALSEILRESEGMAASEPSGEELSRAKSREAGLQLLRLQTSAGLAAELADLWLNGLPPEELERQAARLEALTAQDIGQVSRRYLAGPDPHIVAVGDAAALEKELAGYSLTILTRQS